MILLGGGGGDFGWKSRTGGKRSILSQIYMHVIHAVGHSCFHHFPCQNSLIVGLLCSVFMFYERQCDREVQEWPLHVHGYHHKCIWSSYITRHCYALLFFVFSPLSPSVLNRFLCA